MGDEWIHGNEAVLREYGSERTGFGALSTKNDLLRRPCIVTQPARLNKKYKECKVVTASTYLPSRLIIFNHNYFKDGLGPQPLGLAGAKRGLFVGLR